MSIETYEDALADAVRRTARRFATGVTVVAVGRDSPQHALTANSFVTLSLHPALVGISVKADGRMRSLTEKSSAFGVSVLHESQRGYATHYANRYRGHTPEHLQLSYPDDLGHDAAAPIVPGCLAYFICSLHHIYSIGDHDLIVGSVLNCGVRDRHGPPLIFLDGKLHDGGTP